MINPSVKCSEYDEWYPIWERIEDAIKGQDAIKKKSENYLPKLGGQSQDGYNAYLKRAQYQNLSGRTLQVALGQLFRKPPIVTGLSDELVRNIDLAGCHLNYLSRTIARHVISYNRIGCLIDYSDEQGRPFLKTFKAEHIINWRSEIINGLKKLTLIVIKAHVSTENDNPFEYKKKQIWVELYLEDNIYKTRHWERIEKQGKDEYIIIEGSERIPFMNNNPLDFIPLYFITQNGITDNITESAINDIVNLNLGHYINYADYENMLHWTGAKSIITRGLGPDKTFPIGGHMDFPTDGGAEFLEASSDSGLREEIKHKEELMAMLGSQLLSGKGRYVSSAETSRISSQGEYATLADISNTLSYSMTQILTLLNQWSGSEDEVSIEYNTDFETNEIPPGYLTELIGALQTGQISEDIFYYNLKKYEFYPANWTYEQEKEARKKSMDDQIQNRENKLNQETNNIYQK